jgi:hypothetical protein
MSESLNERADERLALDEIERRWAGEGYKLVLRPSRETVPAFLGGHLPDAIATGKEPGIIFEVVNPRSRSTKTKVSQLQRLFENRPDWRLEVVYTPSDATNLEITSAASIDGALDQAQELADKEPRAALMLAWAGLEALGRARHPDLASRGMSVSSLTDLLISNGDLDQNVQSELRDLGSLRNRIAHGQLDLTPTPKQVRRVVSLARSLQPAA